jgi:hypothetical protein
MDAPDGRYPVGYATEAGHFNLAIHLCRKGIEGDWFGLRWWLLSLEQGDLVKTIAKEEQLRGLFLDHAFSTPMQEAVHERQPDMVRFFASLGCDPDAISENPTWTYPPLVIALSRIRGERGVYEKVLRVDVIRAVLEAGADPTIVVEGKTMPDYLGSEWEGATFTAQRQEAMDLLGAAITRWNLQNDLPAARENTGSPIARI